MRSIIGFSLGLLLVSAVHAAPVRTFEQEIPTTDVRRVEIESEFADVAVSGARGDTLQVKVDVSCSSGWENSCDKAAEGVSIDWRRRGGKLEVKIRGTSKIRSHHITVAAQVSMPRELPVKVNLGVGDVEISGMSGDMEVNAATGDVEIRADEDDVHVVELALGFGDAALYVDGSRTEGGGVLSRGLTWRKSDGRAVIEVDLGSGDATVYLD